MKCQSCFYWGSRTAPSVPDGFQICLAPPLRFYADKLPGGQPPADAPLRVFRELDAWDGSLAMFTPPEGGCTRFKPCPQQGRDR